MLVTEPEPLAGAPGSPGSPGSPGLGPSPGIALDPGQLALLPYSSGTTGLPKPVMLSHANLTAAARQLGAGLALTPRDRFLALAPLAHVMGFVVSLCAPLAAGATVVMLPRYELPALLEAIQRHRVTVVAVPPPVLAALAGTRPPAGTTCPRSRRSSPAARRSAGTCRRRRPGAFRARWSARATG